MAGTDDAGPLGEWQDAEVVAIRPLGRAADGQRIELAALGFGHRWHVSIDVDRVDSEGRSIELTVRLPFGIVNHERMTLMDLDVGHTSLRMPSWLAHSCSGHLGGAQSKSHGSLAV